MIIMEDLIFLCLVKLYHDKLLLSSFGDGKKQSIKGEEMIAAITVCWLIEAISFASS